jgi:hypothetical protein
LWAYLASGAQGAVQIFKIDDFWVPEIHVFNIILICNWGHTIGCVCQPGRNKPLCTMKGSSPRSGCTADPGILDSLEHTPPQVGHGLLNLCFGGSKLPRGPGNPSKRWGASHPTFWKGFPPRGSRDPKTKI